MLRMIALIILFFLTAPIATTTMARAAYRTSPSDEFILAHDDLAPLSNAAAPNNQPEYPSAEDS